MAPRLTQEASVALNPAGTPRSQVKHYTSGGCGTETLAGPWLER